MEFFQHAKLMSTPAGIFGVHASLSLNKSPTNSEKIWNRYTGNLVLQGTGTYQDWHGATHAVGPGCFIHHFPNKYHHIERSSAGWQEYALGLDLPLYQRLYDLGMFPSDIGVIKIHRLNLFVSLFEQLKDVLTNSSSSSLDILSVIQQLFLGLEQESASRVTSKPNPIPDMAKRLAMDFQCVLDLKELAEQASMSYSHFRVLFKQVMGESPGAYRKRHRLAQVRLLLEVNQPSIAKIAQDMGYSDQFALSKEFKQTFGISPKRYSMQFPKDL